MDDDNKDLILDCLRELSDLQLQKKLWLEKIPLRMSSFTETVENLFTDSGLSDALNDDSTGFPKAADAKLRELDMQTALVETQNGPVSILRDPAMRQVRDLAREALELLQRA